MAQVSFETLVIYLISHILCQSFRFIELQSTQSFSSYFSQWTNFPRRHFSQFLGVCRDNICRMPLVTTHTYSLVVHLLINESLVAKCRVGIHQRSYNVSSNHAWVQPMFGPSTFLGVVHAWDLCPTSSCLTHVWFSSMPSHCGRNNRAQDSGSRGSGFETRLCHLVCPLVMKISRHFQVARERHTFW